MMLIFVFVFSIPLQAQNQNSTVSSCYPNHLMICAILSCVNIHEKMLAKNVVTTWSVLLPLHPPPASLSPAQGGDNQNQAFSVMILHQPPRSYHEESTSPAASTVPVVLHFIKWTCLPFANILRHHIM